MHDGYALIADCLSAGSTGRLAWKVCCQCNTPLQRIGESMSKVLMADSHHISDHSILPDPYSSVAEQGIF
jgi:hypothetical protein